MENTQQGRRLFNWLYVKHQQGRRFFSAENWLGSFGFSMRVTGDGKVALCVYDSKSVESASDRNGTLQKLTPEVTTTYQRYLWYLDVDQIKKK